MSEISSTVTVGVAARYAVQIRELLAALEVGNKASATSTKAVTTAAVNQSPRTLSQRVGVDLLV
jgi:hypothetical protein